jgi:hypothetical protein
MPQDPVLVPVYSNNIHRAERIQNVVFGKCYKNNLFLNLTNGKTVAKAKQFSIYGWKWRARKY